MSIGTQKYRPADFAGQNDCQIGRVTGTPRGTIQRWRTGDISSSVQNRRGRDACPICGDRKLPASEYAYLFGLYLCDWQQRIVDQHPAMLLRGLIHSDGCRVSNKVRRAIGGHQSLTGQLTLEKHYEYVRYMFSNQSEDILEIFCAACDRLGVPWTRSRSDHVSVARREGIELLDRLVGPKA